MSIKSLIESIETIVQDVDKKSEQIKEESEVLSQDPVYRDLARSLIGVVSENSPPGCLGEEFGQALSFALSTVCEDDNLDRDLLYHHLADYLSEASDKVRDLYFNSLTDEEREKLSSK